MSIREPRTIEAATKLAERFADIESEVSVTESVRNDAIARANAAADAELAPLIEERELIAEKLGSWWGKGGRTQALGAKPKAKSVELGGCLLGEKKGRATLQIAGEESDVIDTLRGLRWAKPFLKLRYSLDKAQILRSVDGPKSAALAEVGLSRLDGADEFYIKRAEQGQTRG